MNGLPDLKKVFPAEKQKAKSQRTPSPASPPEWPQRLAEMEPTEEKTLKELISDDLTKGAVWFTDTEMAGYHDINGARILCLFDKYETAMSAASSSGGSSNKVVVETSGIQGDLYLLFIRADEYNGTPRRGQEIKIDGRKFYIEGGGIDYDGVYEITLSARSVR